MPSQPLSQPVPDAPVAAALVTDHPMALAGTAGTGRVSRELPAEVTAAVLRTAGRFGVAPGTVYLTAFAVLLRKYTGEDAPVVGELCVPVDPTASFAGLLRRVLTVPAVPSPAAVVFGVESEAVQLGYDAALFQPATVERIAEHYERTLGLLTAAPLDPVGTVQLATAAERARIAGEFNATARPYPRGATVHGLFQQQARRSPARTAVVCGSRLLTYGGLAAQAGQLAARLLAAGARPGRPVGVLLPRGPEQVVATLAVLLAGGGYLPIDPRYPARRVDYLLADSGARVLVAAPGTGGLRFDGVTVPVPAAADSDGPAVDPERWDLGGGQDLASVIYTSGTTGRPKGVEVSHRGVLRLVRNPDYADLNADTRILATCSPVFDVATFEVWGALLNGGALHLVSDEVILDAAALRGALAEQRVTTMWLTSPLFNQLVDQDPATFATLRHLLVGGEALSPRHVARALDACPGLAVTNGYGPTENTTFSTTHRVRAADLDRVPIGRPVANSTAYVVDPDGLLCPVGVPGELCLGGDGVARGYLARPALTAAAFVPDGYGARPGERLYRSGDIARWRPDGVLEFFGRRDHQVKVRGFRIELGEVESALLDDPAVRETVVVVGRRPGGEAYLCGYYVAGSGADVDAAPEAVRARLAQQLPEHMVPAHLMALAALPLNTSGKVDRTALPEPEPAAAHRPGGLDYAAPRDDVERAIVLLAERVLGVRGVGVGHDLRDLGADSLVAARLAAAMATELGHRVEVGQVLRAGTVGRLAELVRSGSGPAGVADRVPVAPELPDYPLSPQQRRIHVEQLKDERAVQYNVPLRVDLPPGVDLDRLVSALHRLTERHEALRTEIVFDGGTPRQRVRPSVHAAVSVAATPVLPVRPFDLAKAPLWRAAVHPAGDRLTVLMDLHHLIVDGLSLAVLFEDLAALYAGDELPPVGLRYRDYAHWASRTPPDPRLAAYWRTVLAEPRSHSDLPLDLPRRQVRQPAGGAVTFELDAQRTAGLRQLAKEHDTTLFTVLAAAYQALLAGISAEPDVTVGMPVAGRTMPGLDRTVGMFANTVCLRSAALPDLSFTDFVRQVDGAVDGAVAHQDHPLEDLVGARDDYGRSPLFDALIALHSARYLHVDFAGARVPLRLGWNGQSPFDLNLQVYEVGGGLQASWQYATGLLLPSTVGRWRDGLLELLDAVLAEPATRLGQLARPAVPARLPDFGFDL